MDGDPEFVGQLRSALQQAGVPGDQIRSYSDGADAVAGLPETSLPSFVLLELQLPGRSGLDVLEWMRTTEPFTELPVFVLSAVGTAAQITRALELKVRSYFLKPEDINELQAIVKG